MKRILFAVIAACLCALHSHAQGADFVPGYNVIFEDHFDLDPVGDFPAKWNTSGNGEIVQIDNVPGKWLKIYQPTFVTPDLLKSLPENCTIEFDLYLHSTSGVAPLVTFGLTTLSTASAGDVYRSHISVKFDAYTHNNAYITYAKNIQDLGSRTFPLNGFVDRILHVSMSINKTRWRVYLDDQKVVDLPKLLTPEFRKNFFVASAPVGPAPEESVYISNVRIAAGDADARSLLIKQLMEQGSAVTGDIQFTPSNQITPESQPVIDQIGQAMQQDPGMNIQVNSLEEIPVGDGFVEGDINPAGSEQIINKDALKLKANRVKDYLVNKFKLKADRIITDAKVKVSAAVQKNKTTSKIKNILTEFVKL